MKQTLTPKEIVQQLDRHIVGQEDAKKAVAIALRNRWRRQQLSDDMKDEVMPKNILMIGSTGVGKTEISRRLAKLVDAPFIKVEATKFTEVGYVGRDVEQIIRDLIEASLALVRTKKHQEVSDIAHAMAEERVIDALAGKSAKPSTREMFLNQLRNGELDDREIEIEITQPRSNMPSFEVPGMPGANIGMMSIGDIFGKDFNKETVKKKVKIADSHDLLMENEAEKLLEPEQMNQEAIDLVENNGIVFLDEIDKICVKDGRGGDVSREGVQRDLLPLIEGTTVSTKYGPVRTEHILFIASGAFHVAKPSDLLPELQGRLPIRVELKSLTRDDFHKILSTTEANLIEQYKALLETEGLKLEFDASAIDTIADISVEVNNSVENIGARRLHTVMERILSDLSFSADDYKGETVTIDKAYVEKHLGELVTNTDLSRFIL